jgi:hypothetical protein
MQFQVLNHSQGFSFHVNLNDFLFKQVKQHCCHNSYFDDYNDRGIVNFSFHPRKTKNDMLIKDGYKRFFLYKFFKIEWKKMIL